MSKLFLIASAAAFGVACASFAGKADYGDYRAIRLARVEEQRLLAMTVYVQKHPDGRWYDETQARRRVLEARVFEVKKSSAAGLEYYLRAYPDGVYASQARARLSAMSQVKQRRFAERERAEKSLLDKQTREAKLRRVWVSRFFDYWTRVFLSISNWGSPLEEISRANPEFSRSFGESPRPICTAEQCIKQYRSQFAIPVPSGTRVERSIEIALRLWIGQTRLQGAEILLPNRGFSRWFELENGLPVVDEETASRQKVLQWALAKLERLIKEAAGESEPSDSAESETAPPDMVFEPLRVFDDAEQPEEPVQVQAQAPIETLPKDRPLFSVWEYSTKFLRIAIFSASSGGADMEYDGIRFIVLPGELGESNQKANTR